MSASSVHTVASLQDREVRIKQLPLSCPSQLAIFFYGLDGQGSIRGRSSEETFSLRHRIHIGSGIHPDSYSMGLEASFPEGKEAGA